MKIRYHKQDIFTYAQAFEVLGKQDNVAMVDAMEDILKNYGKFLDQM
jgi:hypothetical protein